MKSLAKSIFKQAFRFVDPAMAYGREYHEMRKRLSTLRIGSHDELEELECAFLRSLFARISRDVPYYQHLKQFLPGWEKRDPKKLLFELPLVTKQMIQDNVERFTLQSIPKPKRQYVTTGGSTAIPFGFYDVRRRSEAIETAYIHHIWSRAGYHRTLKSAVFRGMVVRRSDRDPLWQYDPFRRAMVYSSYHLRGDDLERIYDHLLDFDPPFIQAYPSAANLLAAYIEESSKPPPSSVKALLLGSENLPAWQRDRIEKAFGANVYSWYGHAEKAVLAAELPGRTELHVLPTYGYIYLLSDSDEMIVKPGIAGEIIATGFTNQATQFVNYRTGDIGVWADPDKAGIDPTYGVARVLERVEGRVQELAVTSTGRRISMTAISTSIFDSVKQFRFVQNRKGSIRMEIVRKVGFTTDHELRIRKSIEGKLGSDMSLEITFVDSLPKAGSGKTRFLIQNIEQD